MKHGKHKNSQKLRYEIKYNFSASKKSAQYIKENGFDNKDKYIIIANPQNMQSTSISPYFSDKIIYNTGIDKYTTFIDWHIYFTFTNYNTNFITNLGNKEIISIDKAVDGVKLIYLTNFNGMVEPISFYIVTNN